MIEINGVFIAPEDVSVIDNVMQTGNDNPRYYFSIILKNKQTYYINFDYNKDNKEQRFKTAQRARIDFALAVNPNIIKINTEDDKN